MITIQFDKIPSDKFSRNAILLKVIDGDTLDVEIDLGWSMKLKERVRLEFVDTPEMKLEELKAGKWVKAKVEEYLPVGTPLIITSTAYDRSGKVRGKYGRTMAHVYHAVEKWSLNQRLLDKQEKLAWATDENGSVVEERILDTLTGLPDKLRKNV